MSLLVYFLGTFVLLFHGGQCELTWEKVLSARLDDIVFDMKLNDMSMMKQVKDLMSMMTATNQQLASFEKRLSDVANCSPKSVVVDEISVNIETYVKKVAEAEVGRRMHLLRRGLEQEKAASMTRFEYLRKNQEQILLRTAHMDKRLNVTQVNVSNLEHEVIGTVYNTSIFLEGSRRLKIRRKR
ncbi:hypothetical protein DPMN_172585 [Dreissena polymorpha]|uniref:Uncharacterized protein n=1 Tax=Dreissena polymorpha TaxID=45954 RepID=A0A9D4E3Y1_DREPO|nr:hypothetical protein DPMN_172585 [Dreissena polymorpha]